MPNASVDKVKLWIFPTLVFVLGTIIWQDVKEIKTDVKALMAQSNIDKTRIDNLEKQVEKLHDIELHKTGPIAQAPTEDGDKPVEPQPAIIPKEFIYESRKRKYTGDEPKAYTHA